MNATIDRIAPTRRPDDPVAGWQSWRNLLFLHWEVDPEEIQQSLPSGLTVDLFEGRAFLGLVPFEMQNVRPWRWVPRFAAFNFPECNVRTYVVHNDQPGVFFYSLDAASRLAVRAARTFWQLPYFHAQMESRCDGNVQVYNSRRSNGDGARKSSTSRPATVHTRYQIGEELGPSRPGTLEHFLLERYLLFVERNETILTGQVHHSAYPAFSVDLLDLDQSLTDAAGFSGLANDPPIRHFSPGVDVEIFALRGV